MAGPPPALPVKPRFPHLNHQGTAASALVNAENAGIPASSAARCDPEWGLKRENRLSRVARSVAAFRCLADLNLDGTVDLQDLLILLANWG